MKKDSLLSIPSDFLTDPLSGFFTPYYGAEKRELRLVLDTTNKCNLRCVMCHFSQEEIIRAKLVQWPQEAFDLLEFDVLPFVSHAVLSAGTEPLMWKRFPELLECCRRAEVPTFEMITNGLLLTPALAEAIVASGMTCVQLSLEGASKEMYESVRVGGTFERFLAGVEMLREAKARANSTLPELQFNVTLMKRNLHALEDIVHLAARLDVEHMVFQHLIVAEGLGMESESLVDAKNETNRALESVRALCQQYGIRIANQPEDFQLVESADAPPTEACDDEAHPEAAATACTPTQAEPQEPPPMPPSEPAPAPAPPPTADVETLAPLDLDALPEKPLCDAPWTQFEARSDGSVVPCCFWYNQEPPMGNMHTESFLDIWQGSTYRKLRHQILTGELGPNCRACPVSGGIGDINDESAFHSSFTV